MEFYQENGPSVVAREALVHSSNSFGMDGYLALLVGQNVPHGKPYSPPEAEKVFWKNRSAALAEDARQGMTVPEALGAIRAPGLKWA